MRLLRHESYTADTYRVALRVQLACVNGGEEVVGSAACKEVTKELSRLDWNSIVERFEQENRVRTKYGNKPHRGKQRFLNSWIADRLRGSWQSNIVVMESGLAHLTLDFLKGDLGVVVSFKHGTSLGLDLIT